MLEDAGEEDQFGVGGGQLRQNEADSGAIGLELFPEGPEVVHFVPVQLFQIQNETALAPRQGIADALSQTFSLHFGKDAFQAQPHLLFGMLQLDLDGEIRS